MNILTSCFKNPIKKPITTLHDNNYANDIETEYDTELKTETELIAKTELEKEKQYLYIILPYFNFCNCKSRYKLFIDFVERYNNIKAVRLCIIEAKIHGTEFQLPNTFKNIFKHIGITLNGPIWIKESIINVVIKSLPKKWKYVAWIDADITFLNKNWVNDTISTLQTADIIQLFQTCVNMGPSNEAFKIDKSFCYMYKTQLHEWRKDAKYGFWHSGFAWACTHKAYDAMGGLIDYGILGAGDHHMSLALIGKVNYSHPGNIHENYKKKLLEYQENCLKNKLVLGYVPGTIIHHWHGRLEDRKYIDRWNILTKNKYDPLTDIYYTHSGYIQYTHKGKRFIEEISKYFRERNEDINII
jgi:hypothetical protein